MTLKVVIKRRRARKRLKRTKLKKNDKGRRNTIRSSKKKYRFYGSSDYQNATLLGTTHDNCDVPGSLDKGTEP